VSDRTSVDTPLSLVGVLIVSVLTALVTLLTTLAGTTGALNHMERASPLLTSLVFGFATVAIGLTAFGSYFSSLVKSGTDPNAALQLADKTTDMTQLAAAAPGSSLEVPWKATWNAWSVRIAATDNAHKADARRGQPEAVPFSREAQKNAVSAAEFAAEVADFIRAAAKSPDQAGSTNDAISAEPMRRFADREAELARLWAESARISALTAPPRQPSVERPNRKNFFRVLWQAVLWVYYGLLHPWRSFIHLWRRSDWQSIAAICFRYGLLLFVIALIAGATLAGWSATTPAAPALSLSQNASTGVVSGSAHAEGMRPQDDLIVCLISEPTNTVIYADSSGPDMAGDAADSFSIPKNVLNRVNMLTSLSFGYNSEGASAGTLCQRFTGLGVSRYSSVTLRLPS
jgi:hypothetical protein